MLKKRNSLLKRNKKGMAVIEAIPVLFMLVMVFNFSLGFFGAIHSGILNSIGAYNYTFETFRYRSNLMYFRPDSVGDINYKTSMNRVHGVIQDGSEESLNEQKGRWPATIRYINFSFDKSSSSENKNFSDVTENSRNYGGRGSGDNIWFANSTYLPSSSPIRTPRIWVKTVYGICINADCTVSGDGQKDRVGE